MDHPEKYNFTISGPGAALTPEEPGMYLANTMIPDSCTIRITKMNNRYSSSNTPAE